MNSITLPLWRSIEKEVGSEINGPIVFHTIIAHAQVATASMIQSLTERLKRMSLKDEPGQHVINFSNKIIEIGRRLDGAILAVPNICSLVIAPYLQCDVEEFQIFAINKHAIADKSMVSSVPTIFSTALVDSPKWEQEVMAMNTRFRELQAQNLWTPLKSSKPRDEISILQGELQALKQTLAIGGRRGGNGQGGRGSSLGGHGGRGGGRDMSKVKCHHCGETGHICPNCPKLQQGSPQSGGGATTGGDWKSKIPKEGEPCVKTIDGVTWKVCLKCKKPKWLTGPKAHTAAKHKSLAELRGSINHAQGASLSDSQTTLHQGQGRLSLTPGLFMCPISAPPQSGEPVKSPSEAVSLLVETVPSDEWDNEDNDTIDWRDIDAPIEMFPGYLHDKIEALRLQNVAVITKIHEETLAHSHEVFYDCIIFDEPECDASTQPKE